MSEVNLEDLKARLECINLVQGFARCVDDRNFNIVLELFADDAIFERPDLIAKGKSEIAEIWQDRPDTVFTRHLCGPTWFFEQTPDALEGKTPLVLYQTMHSGEGPPSFSVPTIWGEFHDRFVLTDRGWKIAHRRGIVKMVPKP